MSASLLFKALESRAAARPDSPVLVGDRQTWRADALLAAIDELATRLTPSRAIAVLADNGPAWVMADLAALRARIPHIPLPGFFSPEQLAHVLDQAGVDTVLTDQPERIGALDAGFSITGQWNGLIWMRRPLSTEEATTQLPAGTAKVSFTSGSTGNPKGACLSANGLIDTAAAVAARLADLPIERHLVTLPLALLLENSAGIYAPLLRGAEIHLPGLQTLGWKGMAGFDPAALQKIAGTIRPSSMILVPELLKAWTLYLAASGQKAPTSLSFVAVGGARVDAEALAMARALGLPAYQGYGLTECGSVVSLNRPGDDSNDVGRPLGHVTVRGVEGEIVIRSRAFLGYIGGDGAADADEFSTGDLGHLDANGHLHLSGRRKNLLITSDGRNIAPEWIEATLLAQPIILQAVVTGDARPWLSAVLVTPPGTTAAAIAAAIARANDALPDYARIGHWITADAPFALQNGLATGNGRPQRSAILSRYAEALAAGYATPLSEQCPTKETADVLL
ncbi:MAG: long-chain acyl-CoA synthetase [Pseudomonadota bacterium]|nr:long-chain acyl-CoA synthetase [Pseudomonadota bacterium]